MKNRVIYILLCQLEEGRINTCSCLMLISICKTRFSIQFYGENVGHFVFIDLIPQQRCEITFCVYTSFKHLFVAYYSYDSFYKLSPYPLQVFAQIVCQSNSCHNGVVGLKRNFSVWNRIQRAFLLNVMFAFICVTDMDSLLAIITRSMLI